MPKQIEAIGENVAVADLSDKENVGDTEEKDDDTHIAKRLERQRKRRREDGKPRLYLHKPFVFQECAAELPNPDGSEAYYEQLAVKALGSHFLPKVALTDREDGDPEDSDLFVLTGGEGLVASKDLLGENGVTLCISLARRLQEMHARAQLRTTMESIATEKKITAEQLKTISSLNKEICTCFCCDDDIEPHVLIEHCATRFSAQVRWFCS